jgi:hypothetical protein
MYAKRNIKRRFNGTFPCPNLSAPEKFYFEMKKTINSENLEHQHIIK